jgi:hypothetical protein
LIQDFFTNIPGYPNALPDAERCSKTSKVLQVFSSVGGRQVWGRFAHEK